MYGVSERYSENIAKNVLFTGIAGTIETTDSEISITDKDIKEGSLSINRKMNSGGEFRAGGVCSDELSMTLLDYGGSISDLDGAAITLEFRLYTDSGFTDYDSVPLGVFTVDGSTIKRSASTISFKAYDGIMLFDRAAFEMTNTLYNLVHAACGYCGVAFGMTQSEFEALPNATITAPIDTARIQTERDLLMYVGIITNSFAQMSRDGKLVFKQLTCETDDNNMVIPVREIGGNIRFSTEFSDNTARVTSFVMNRDGVRLKNTNKITSSSAECLALEWTENPLLADFSDSEVKEILTTAVSGIYKCINRAYKADFSGDPALDVGDYVRLRGGQIDTARGYGTGMITSQTWKYRGSHTIQCNMPSTVAVSSSASAASSDGVSDDDTDRIQPKSQTEKRIDALEKKIADSGEYANYLQTTTGAQNDGGADAAVIGTDKLKMVMYRAGEAGQQPMITLSTDDSSAKPSTLSLNGWGPQQFGITYGSNSSTPAGIKISNGFGDYIASQTDSSGNNSILLQAQSAYIKLENNLFTVTHAGTPQLQIGKFTDSVYNGEYGLLCAGINMPYVRITGTTANSPVVEITDGGIQIISENAYVLINGSQAMIAPSTSFAGSNYLNIVWSNTKKGNHGYLEYVLDGSGSMKIQSAYDNDGGGPEVYSNNDATFTFGNMAIRICSGGENEGVYINGKKVLTE